MVVSHENGFVFVAIPKTASMTISQGLVKHCRGVLVQPYHAWKRPTGTQGYVVFSVVRDPYERLYSWYWFRCVQRNDGIRGWTFEKWMEYCTECSIVGTKDGNVPELWFPQAEICEMAGVTRVVLFESLEMQLMALPFVGPAMMNHMRTVHQHKNNKPRTSPAREMMTEAERDMVWSAYKIDFETYGYER